MNKTKPIPILTEEEVTKFWANVNFIPDAGVCWVWTAGRDSKGYGAFSIWRDGQWHQFSAHRVAAALAFGADKVLGWYVCHDCDNPPCCNPAHLYNGTPQSNMDDKWRRGRAVITPPSTVHRGDDHWTRKHPELMCRGDSHHARKHPEQFLGDKNPNFRFTLEQIEQIKGAFMSGVPRAEICRRFGISKTHLYRLMD